jgi:ferric-dicitrate binding protein FerR (iron transport regulator)
MSVDDQREFIISCLSNPLDEAKQAALGQWLQESVANRTLYAEIKQLWDAADGLPASPLHVEEGWQTLSRQISGTSAHVVELKREIVSSTREEAPGVTAPFFIRFRWVAAACLPLLLVAGYLIRGRSTGMTTIQTTTITKLSLPDGTSIRLHPGTVISYDPAFAERRITLSKGDAYFSVSPDEKRTFIVQLASSTITVLGTAFDVKASDDAAKVVVTQGKIRLATATDTLILTKGQQGEVNRGKLVTPGLSFMNEEAGTVATTLSAHYHVKITLPDGASGKKRITANFQSLSANDAQQLLNAILEQ